MRTDDVRRIPVRAIGVRATAPTSAPTTPRPLRPLDPRGTLGTLTTPVTRGPPGTPGTRVTPRTPSTLGTPGTLGTHGTRWVRSARQPTPFVRARLRACERGSHALRLPGAQIEPPNVTVLRRRINNVGIFRIA